MAECRYLNRSRVGCARDALACLAGNDTGPCAEMLADALGMAVQSAGMPVEERSRVRQVT
jgi:hypothetical protein